MSSEAHQKVSASHLRRNAYLYVRQSTVLPKCWRTARAPSASTPCANVR